MTRPRFTATGAARTALFAACTLIVSACAGDGAAPPQTAEMSCRDEVYAAVTEDYRNYLDGRVAQGLSTTHGPTDFYSLYPDCP